MSNYIRFEPDSCNLDQLTQLLKDTQDKTVIVCFEPDDDYVQTMNHGKLTWFKKISEKYMETAVFVKIDNQNWKWDATELLEEKTAMGMSLQFRAYYNGQLFKTVIGDKEDEVKKIAELGKEEIEDIIKNKKALEKIFPLVYDFEGLEKVKNMKCITAVTFVCEGVDEKVDQFYKEIDDWIKSQVRFLFKVDLNGMYPCKKLGYNFNIHPGLGCPYVVFYSAKGEMFQTLEGEEATLQNVKDLFKMTEEQCAQSVKTRKERETECKNFCLQLDDQESYDKFLDDEENLIVIDYSYWPEKYVNPCCRYAPTFLELGFECSSEGDNKIKFGQVNCAINGHAAQHAGMDAIPFYKFWMNGKEVGRYDGKMMEKDGMDKDVMNFKLCELIEENIKKFNLQYNY